MAIIKKKVCIKFKLNGQNYSFRITQLFTLLDLVHFLNYEPNLILIECNNKICSRTIWGEFYIKSNDRIEFLTIVGGG